MGNRFDNQQVNNFLVNQEVTITCKNKFVLFIQNSLNYNSLITTQLQPNYNSFNFKLVSTMLGIFLWNF